MSNKIKDLMECFINPNKSRILLEISQKGEVTAKQLQQIYTDIPPATLYRTLKRLLNAGIIVVASENKIRGVIEKVYTINQEAGLADQNFLKENNGLVYFQMFSNFTMALMKEFQVYAEKPNIDILNDGSGFSAGPICVTGEELQQLAVKIGEVIKPYRENPPEPGRKMHTAALIFTPPEDL